MRMYDLIEKKKHGDALTREELHFFVQGATDGTIPDYQLSAFLMAVCFRGMSDGELAALSKKQAEIAEQAALEARDQQDALYIENNTEVEPVSRENVAKEKTAKKEEFTNLASII